MLWLDPTIRILFIFSSTLGEGIGLVDNFSFPHDRSLTPRFQPLLPAKLIFIGIGIRLEVSLSPWLLWRFRAISILKL
jgi:hypothetical protein